nr:ACYPI003647 [Acyrthosiphon pisum]
MKPDAEKFLNEFTWKLKRFMEQTQEELFNMIPKTERENTKKAIGYLSMYMSGAFSAAQKKVTNVSNKSFDALPDNIKTKLLDIGNDIDDFLKRIRGFNDFNDPKTSQKTSK